MSLEYYVALCGGEENLLRVLIPDSRLIFAVKERDCLSDELDPKAISRVGDEWQVTFVRPSDLEAELLQLGQKIAKRQQLALSEAMVPVACSYRPKWHVSPPQGLLNDPNGFIYHQGQYHLFYQWYPFGCVHKDKYWAHLTSKDLVNWHWQPVALTPSDWFDSHGVFSGHAVSDDETLMLFYTGNTRIDEQRDRHTTQCLATSTDGIHFTKHGPVIESLPPGVTAHIRDPKVIRHQQEWLMLLGAQTTELKGRLAVYRSDDLRNWTFSALHGDDLGDFGYMWECPDWFELGGETFAVLGPQGIESFSPLNTIPHHNGIARASWDGQQLQLADFVHLDYGFDFYAPQTLLTPDGRRVMCGWMGLPDEVDQPSSDHGWVHQLTAPRELTYRDGTLYQWPVEELMQLMVISSILNLSNVTQRLDVNSYQLEVELQWGQTLNLFEGHGQKVALTADDDHRRLVLDRCETQNRAPDERREVPLTSDSVRLLILVDTSSVEIFINGGEAVMTSRVFVDAQSTGISVTGPATRAELRYMNQTTEPFA
ncbi:glycoside hydrolase family 32 protein [Vibrio scophthalmi]|uniref:glycoside hydrolase family 32 protein n=1 Tax=Vibrio scophthalmi TaxID=45658 RepID=UPI002FF14D0E